MATQPVSEAQTSTAAPVAIVASNGSTDTWNNTLAWALEDESNMTDFEQQSPYRTSHDLQDIVRNLRTNVSPTLACAGIVLNAICLAVACRRANTSVSAIHYVIGVVTVDTVRLGCMFHTWLNDQGYNLFFIGGWCQFVTFGESFSDFLGTWFTVALATDRFLRLSKPASSRGHFTPWRARVVILALVITATVVFLNTSLIVGVIQVPNYRICDTLPAFGAIAVKLDQADVFINAVVPELVLVVLVLAIVVRLFNSSATNRPRCCCCGFEAYQLDAANSLMSDHAPTRCGLCLVLSFLVLTVPYQALRARDTVAGLWFPPTPAQQLRSFLYQELLLHIKYLKLALDGVIVIASLGFCTRRHASGRGIIDSCERNTGVAVPSVSAVTSIEETGDNGEGTLLVATPRPSDLSTGHVLKEKGCTPV